MHGHNHKYNTANITRIFWCVAIIFIILLNGCATHYQKDGPPPFDVDVSKIPNAKPKSEHLAKSGNMSVYRVRGQNYHVMATSKNYQERGIASWYGMKFHRQRTSSGEPYDLLAMTAAHKTLPLPTYVEVTNIKNGRKIIVKVNDRGPFKPNRIIDLSYVAAKKLGMTGHGTALVDVKAIDPNEAFSHRSLWAHNNHPSPSINLNNNLNNNTHRLAVNKKYSHQHIQNKTKTMYIQVGAYNNKQTAEKIKTRLGTVVSSPIQITHLAKQPKSLYRVNIGPIKDVATADTIKKKLRAIGITTKHIKV